MSNDREDFERWRDTVNHVPTGDEPGYPAEAQLHYPDQEAAAWLGFQAARAMSTTPSTIPLNKETRAILGRICFQCIGIAKRLREQGHEIRPRAEDEQAAVIHFLLNCYLSHGAGWADEAERRLHEETTK